jgi:hypothetical protein
VAQGVGPEFKSQNPKGGVGTPPMIQLLSMPQNLFRLALPSSSPFSQLPVFKFLHLYRCSLIWVYILCLLKHFLKMSWGLTACNFKCQFPEQAI